MTDLRLKEFYEQDNKLATTGIDYEGIWRVLGHASALHFVIPYYTENFYYKLDNEEIIEAYNDLKLQLICNLTDRDFKLNIYDIAGVYEHKRDQKSHTGKFEKHFNTISYFANDYIPEELTPIPKLKENGAFITGFTEIITAILPSFDMTNLKECVLAYGNNYDMWNKKRQENIQNHIDGLEKEANKVIRDIHIMSPKEAAYFCGKFSLFVHYGYQYYWRSSMVEAFFTCKSKLPENIRKECFADKFSHQKIHGFEQLIKDLVILDAFSSGLDYTLKAIFHSNSSIERVYEDLAADDVRTFVGIIPKRYL